MRAQSVTLSQMPKRPNGTGSLYLRGRRWWIQFHRNGKPYQESSKSESREEAERLLHQRLGEIATDRFQGFAPRRITIANLCEMVLDDYRLEKKRSLKITEWRVGKHLTAIGGVRALEFGPSQIKRYVTSRRQEGAADATINRELAIVRRGFVLAVRANLIPKAPFIPKLDEDNVRQGFLEHADYLKIRESLPQHLKAVFVVGYHVGMRIGELRKIRWEQVDIAAGEIRLEKRQAKAKKARTIPIYGDMKAWLEMQKANRDQKWPTCPWVFHRYTRPLGSHVKGFVEGCKAAGFPALRFHDLRRSAVRNMERAGMPRKIAMEISGHKTEAIYRRYDIVSQQDMRLAAAKMETYLEAQNAGPITANLVSIPGKAN